jgi:hypothetical protein
VTTHEIGTVYLIHFARPVAHALHYLGWTSRTTDERLSDHFTGDGHVLVLRGRGEVVRVWPGTRHDERRLKNRKNSRELCPVCKPGYLEDCAARMRRIRKNKRDRVRRTEEFGRLLAGRTG